MSKNEKRIFELCNIQIVNRSSNPFVARYLNSISHNKQDLEKHAIKTAELSILELRRKTSFDCADMKTELTKFINGTGSFIASICFSMFSDYFEKRVLCHKCLIEECYILASELCAFNNAAEFLNTEFKFKSKHPKISSLMFFDEDILDILTSDGSCYRFRFEVTKDFDEQNKPLKIEYNNSGVVNG